MFLIRWFFIILYSFVLVIGAIIMSGLVYGGYKELTKTEIKK